MSVLTMPTLNGWGKKVGNITAILILAGMVIAYLNGFLSNYALASDLKAHIKQSDDRYSKAVRRDLKRQIKSIKNDLALYELDSNMRALTPREKLHVTQLKNLKDEYKEELDETNPR